MSCFYLPVLTHSKFPRNCHPLFNKTLVNLVCIVADGCPVSPLSIHAESSSKPSILLIIFFFKIAIGCVSSLEREREIMRKHRSERMATHNRFRSPLGILSRQSHNCPVQFSSHQIWTSHCRVGCVGSSHLHHHITGFHSQPRNS